MANRYPFPQHQARPGMAPANPTGFPTINMWQHQPQAQVLNHPQHHHLTEEQRQREYLKQQQKLRLMAATTNKQPVNADKLIENLLETKDMFRPRTNISPTPSAVMPTVQVPARHGITAQVPLMGSGAARPVQYPQVYSSLPQHHSSVPVSSTSDVGSGLAKRTPQENSRVGFQLPAWLSSQSPSLPTLYRHVWTLVGMDKGLVDTAKIFPLLLTSGLPTDVLGYIWGLANQKIAGQLTEDELYIVLALVGLAQSGCTFNNLSILNLVPQAPIPNLNLNSFQPLTMRTELAAPPSGEDTSQAIGVASSVISESPLSTSFSAPLTSEESIDDFSDFQSAACSQEPEFQAEPDPKTIQDYPIHIKEVAASTPSVAFQGISPSSDGHKFQSIFSLGSSSRGIGSRLANHSLGAPKQTKNRHHKHHHHHHHHHHRTSHSATHPSSQLQENSEQTGPQIVGATQMEEDEFSDFQQAKEPALTQTAGADELFPKCSLKTPPKKPYLLKESAIRLDKSETNICFESPVHMKVNRVSNEKETNTTIDSRVYFGPSGFDAKVNTVIPPDLQTPTTHELLSVEEDKYSALRALSMSDQEPADPKETVPDDFGDFLSAEPVSTEDSFAALASREIKPKTGEVNLETNSFWPSTTASPQSAEFQLDDWGTFESTPEVRVSARTSTSNDLLSTTPIESSVSGLTSALEGLYLKTANIDFSWNGGNKGARKDVEKSAILLETSTASPAPSTSASDTWMEPNDEFSQSQSTSKGYGLTFLGKIYNDHNQIINNTKNDLFVLENEPQAVSGSFVIKTEEDDEFGEFIGPEAWPDDSKFTTKETAFEGQAMLRVKDATCDTQSVSSLELPVLSRHGSLPSLDLKIFPSGADKAGLLQPWDCSPQGIDLQIKEWCRCVQSCLQLLQAALATFTSISNESVVEEVVTAHEGKEYLLNLLEVYGICKRVKQSSTGITSDSKLDSILAEVDIVWSSMEPYFTRAELKVADMEFGCNAVDGSQEQSACGICLTSVGSEIVQDNHNNVYPLEYGGQVYHAACANLWVNCVDCRLPALATTGSLL